MQEIVLARGSRDVLFYFIFCLSPMPGVYIYAQVEFSLHPWIAIHTTGLGRTPRTSIAFYPLSPSLTIIVTGFEFRLKNTTLNLR